MNRSLTFFALVLLLAGCAGAPTRQASTTAASETPAQTAETPLFGETPAIAAPETKPVMSGNRAVIALLDRAQLDSVSGNREAAGVSLERALRIEPRNPWLWHELAQLRLTQGQYAQAITLARKSTSFGGQDVRLQVANLRLIGDARIAQGDSAGAEQAFKQAQELEQPEAIPGL